MFLGDCCNSKNNIRMNILGEERIVCCICKFVLTIFTITTLFYILVDLLKLLKIIRYEHKFDISKFVIFQYDSGYLVIFCHCGIIPHWCLSSFYCHCGGVLVNITYMYHCCIKYRFSGWCWPCPHMSRPSCLFVWRISSSY